MSETDQYFRVFDLCSNSGGKVIRALVEDAYQKLGYTSLEDFLNFDTVRHNLFHLWEKRCCCKAKINRHAVNIQQWQKMYVTNFIRSLGHPPDGNCHCQYDARGGVSLDIYDVSLGAVVLSLDATKNNLSADCHSALKGVKDIRNKLLHMSKTELDSTEFNEFWRDLCNYLTILAKSLGSDIEKDIEHDIISIRDKVYDSKDKKVITSFVESFTELSCKIAAEKQEEQTTIGVELSGIKSTLENHDSILSEILAQLSIRNLDRQSQAPAPRQATIEIIKGNITHEKVDVIVNTTSEDLKLSIGRLSKSILRAGGMVLQTELNKNYPDGIQCGQVAITSGGNLACKSVFHGWLHQWSANKACLKDLENFMMKCLELADENNYESIAFPALGTGILEYPVEEVSMKMYESVATFFSNNQRSTLKEVHFVLYPSDEAAIKAFKTEEERVNGKFVKL